MRSYCSIEEGKGVSKSLNSNSRNLAIASNKTANWWFVGWSLDSSQLAVPLCVCVRDFAYGGCRSEPYLGARRRRGKKNGAW